MNIFEDMGLPEALLQSLQKMGFEKATPIQKSAIPVALEGKDILGSAQTGTGKTAAFGIPLVAKLLSDPNSAALVMAPTRELATQVIGQLHKILGRKSKIKTALLIGGEPMPRQLARLQRKPRLIVGTPGRINDHLRRKSLKLDHINMLVLDETDRMLDMGFTIQIEEILLHMPQERQTLLFSATLPRNISEMAKKYLSEPVRIAMSSPTAPAQNIKQEVLKINDDEKYPTLLSQLEERKGSIVLFVKTKRGADKISMRLSKAGHRSAAIHGDLRQHKRNRVIASFREKKHRILVATDVAARGLDIPHIEHVINYDLPQCPEDYVHRIGRTARAGASGSALNLVTSSDKKKWTAINQFLNPEEKTSHPKQGKPKPSKSNKKKKAFQTRKPFKERGQVKGKKNSQSFFKKRKKKKLKKTA